MAESNPLVSLIGALAGQNKRTPIEKKTEQIGKKAENIISRLKRIQSWQKQTDKTLVVLGAAIAKAKKDNSQDGISEKFKSLKESLDNINARLKPRIFDLGESGEFQYDPLAPEGKQVTKLSVAGKASVGATKKDIELVLKKAAFIFNQEMRNQQTVSKKEDTIVKNTKTPVTAKTVEKPAKKDFTETYKRLSYEMEEDDPVFLLKKSMEKNFAKVFKELKKLRTLIQENSGGIGGGIIPIGGRKGGGGAPAGGKPGAAKPGGRFSKLGTAGRILGGTALLGVGVGAYDALRTADPSRTSGDALTDMAVKTGVAGVTGAMTYSAVKYAQQKSKAVSRLRRARKINPDAFKGTTKSNRVWSAFLKYLNKRAPKLAAKAGAKLATMGALATVPFAGWVAAGATGLFFLDTLMDVYDLYKEYQTLTDEEKAQYSEDVPAAPTGNRTRVEQETSLSGRTRTRTSAGQEQRPAAGQSGQGMAPPTGTVAASSQELKGVSESGSAKEAMSFFQHKGWTREQSAGIVANLMAESGTNLKTDSYNAGEQAYGLAQWRPPRQEDYKNRFSGGKPITQAGFQEQLEFVNWELNNTEKKAGDALRQAKDAPTAAAIVDSLYERSKGLARQKRIDYASQLLDDKYVNKISAGGPRATATQSAPNPPGQTPAVNNQSSTFRGTINRGTAAATPTTPAPQPVTTPVPTTTTTLPEQTTEAPAAASSTPDEVTVTARALPREESYYALEQSGMMGDTPVVAAAALPTPVTTAQNSGTISGTISGFRKEDYPEYKDYYNSVYESYKDMPGGEEDAAIEAESNLKTDILAGKVPPRGTTKLGESSPTPVTPTTTPAVTATKLDKVLAVDKNDYPEEYKKYFDEAMAGKRNDKLERSAAEEYALLSISKDITEGKLPLRGNTKMVDRPVEPTTTATPAAATTPVPTATSSTSIEDSMAEMYGQPPAESTKQTTTPSPVTTATPTTNVAPAPINTPQPAQKTNTKQTISFSQIVESLGLAQQTQSSEGGGKFSKIAGIATAIGGLSNLFKPKQERAQGEALSNQSAELESTRLAASIPPPVIIQQPIQGGGGGGTCRFVQQQAPLKEASVENTDSSLKSAFSRDKWA